MLKEVNLRVRWLIIHGPNSEGILPFYYGAYMRKCTCLSFLHNANGDQEIYYWKQWDTIESSLIKLRVLIVFLRPNNALYQFYKQILGLQNNRIINVQMYCHPRLLTINLIVFYYPFCRIICILKIFNYVLWKETPIYLFHQY